ncbi:MAG: TldD/PmbA family protein [Dictyoglomaceae bacterium]
MHGIGREILNYASRLGVDYVDVRIVRRQKEELRVKNGILETGNINETYGFGVRILYKGAWGFASSFNLENFKSIVDKAFAIAKASASVNKDKVELSPLTPSKAQWKSSYKIDPFTIPFDKKLNLLFETNKIMRMVPGISIAISEMEFFKEDKIFLSSEGSEIEQSILESGAGISAFAIEGNDLQRRSYPNSFGGDYRKAGWEFIEELNLLENAEKIAKEAVALLKAEPLPEMITTLILDGTQLALQIHESCGHSTELDRVLGTEASFAGTSFLTLDKKGKFQYGSEIINIVADATHPYGLGSFAYDDEGVPAQKSYLVKDGLFVGYLTSRETAKIIGETSNGTMRADGWNRIPIIRMTNINLLPGDKSLEEIIESTKNGVYMSTIKNWSIDDKRLNFHFGCEIAYEIKNGKIGKIYKNPYYTGITYEFWRSCDAIANEKYWRVWGVPNCGKGEPMQIARVGHGVSPARFRKVKVGGK